MAINRPTRAERNNNPGNIRRDGTQWQGMSPVQDDPDFVHFIDAAHGFRAMATILRNYSLHDHVRTLHDVIYRWAPPNENMSDLYTAFVTRRTGIKSDQPLDLTDKGTVALICAAIAEYESGFPWNFTYVQQGVALA